ncbi:MAG: hypothetical protein ACLS8R_05020 [Anaeromassilibacillus sp.]
MRKNLLLQLVDLLAQAVPLSESRSTASTTSSGFAESRTEIAVPGPSW